MKIANKCPRLLSLLISSAILLSPVAAQQKKNSPAPPKRAARTEDRSQPAPTFDDLLSADSYKICIEVKNVGQLIQSPSVADLLEPILRLGGPPKEFKTLVKFANAHAEAVAASRMMVVAWPARPQLPDTLLVLEFSSVDEARKFEPQLREFMPTLFPSPSPSPAASPEQSPEPDQDKVKPTADRMSALPAKATEQKEQPPPFVITQLGTLVLISDAAFSVKNLRPKNRKLLTDDANFREVHNRFATDPIVVFFNQQLEDKNRLAPPPTNEGEAEVKLAQANNSEPVKLETSAAPAEQEMPKPSDPQNETVTSEQVENLEVTNAPEVVLRENSSTEPTQNIDAAYNSLFSSLFGGESKWPDALGVAINFDSDSYSIRALLVNESGPRSSAVPFMPSYVSGPALNLGSPSILPDDTELFVAASLDAPQIYQAMLKTISDENARMEKTGQRTVVNNQSQAPFAALEKQLGLKIKDDLLPVLGNEIALGLSVASLTEGFSSFFIGAAQARPPATNGSESDQSKAKPKRGPVLLISLRDKEAARTLVPKVIEGLGFKGASLLAQKERRGDAEIVSYANAFSYAFVGDFLLLSTDPGTVRHVVDSYVNNQTLSSDNHYRNSVSWQPHQVTGQIYVSPALMDSYRTYANEPTALLSDKVREFLLRVSPLAEPVSYALSNDAAGPLHEVRIPKNLVLMTVAAISSEANQSPMMQNEGMARVALTMIAASEERYKTDKGQGNFATLDQLIADQMVAKDLIENHGYRIELTVSGDKFEVSAVPLEYGKTGRLSYFIDQTMTIKGADHGGGPATADDKPIQ